MGNRHRRGRAMLGRGVAAATLIAWVLVAALCLSLPASAQAQGVKDWDGVTQAKFDDAATNGANSTITEAQEERDAAQEAMDDLDCSLCVEAREFDEASEAASEATRQSVAELVDARAQAIEGTPGDTEAELQAKLDALDTLEAYAEDWTPDGPNEGYADLGEVEAAQAEVQAQLSAASATSSPEAAEPTTQPTTAAPAGGDGGGGPGPGTRTPGTRTPGQRP